MTKKNFYLLPWNENFEEKSLNFGFFYALH